jgi:CobW/HypB/UreG, nucleotide-binding domain
VNQSNQSIVDDNIVTSLHITFLPFHSFPVDRLFFIHLNLKPPVSFILYAGAMLRMRFIAMMFFGFATITRTSAFQVSRQFRTAATVSFHPTLRLPNGRQSALFVSTSASAKPNEKKESSETSKVPITLLSGFLGSGKTSTLQHLLENTDGLQIGVIVNDMASVNIDAKLVSAAGKSNSGILELQNGCACCSLADELLTTVDTLLESRQASKGKSDDKKSPFDAVVVELSGVADPIAIQSNWNAAKMQGHPVTKKSRSTANCDLGRC